MMSFLDKEIDPAFARRARLILANLDIRPGMKILDAGCGRGFYTLAVAKMFPRIEVVGVDMNSKYLDKAKKQSSHTTESQRITLTQGDITKLPFPEEHFDRIICSEVLEHIPNDQKAIQELYRVLKKGGLALISVPPKNYPCCWDPPNFILERTLGMHIPATIWWLAGIWADHLRLYSEKELVAKLKTVGFRIDKLWHATSYCLPFSHFLLYGIGKNLVERGLVGKSINRFSREEASLLTKIFQWPFHLIDRFNSDDCGQRSVNLIMKVSKR